MPYKLIMIGERERLLFDITKPDGENIARNLVTRHPEIAARLETKLKAWSATLKPPGLPALLDPHHEDLFAEHDLIPKGETARTVKKGEPEGGVQGWLCRNGTLTVKDGALTITPDANLAPNARPFLTHSTLDVAGPVTIILHARAKQGGTGTLTWRTKTEKDFIPANTASFDWPLSAGWQEIKAGIPVKSRLMHLRIMPAKGSAGLEIQSIELHGRDSKPQVWQFGGTK